ncbi:cyclic nucleotide-binding domain-containing protein [Pseudofrankia sp. BMG5.37]|nr:cyclic nucleotide-binding domain-containing protein [Pseudofrankia sp. BMG5.37]OHV46566.1 hypothetical protein BCD48_20825 [Pseudofrankia sp. BMG5.36]
MGTRVVESSVMSLSWIPSEAIRGFGKVPFSLGVSHYDEPLPAQIDDFEALRGADRFRFANRLSAAATFGDDGELLAFRYTGGAVTGSTTVRLGGLGATFAGVAMPDIQAEPVVGDGWVRFTQTGGGRTALPLPRQTARPPYFRLQSPVTWSTLSLTLFADGRAEYDLVGASTFPRHWVYDAAGHLVLKSGITDWSSWTSQPSWRHTPWGDEDSPALVVAAETALERELSHHIMRAGRRPQVDNLAAGTELVRQGTPGDALFLLLDGVLGVDVDGTRIAEVGPGAIVGERSLLEGGLRTATLTALTAVRVARAGRDAVDLAALAQLARGHRREEGDGAPGETGPRGAVSAATPAARRESVTA